MIIDKTKSSDEFDQYDKILLQGRLSCANLSTSLDQCKLKN